MSTTDKPDGADDVIRDYVESAIKAAKDRLPQKVRLADLIPQDRALFGWVPRDGSVSQAKKLAVETTGKQPPITDVPHYFRSEEGYTARWHGKEHKGKTIDDALYGVGLVTDDGRKGEHRQQVLCSIALTALTDPGMSSYCSCETFCRGGEEGFRCAGKPPRTFYVSAYYGIRYTPPDTIAGDDGLVYQNSAGTFVGSFGDREVMDRSLPLLLDKIFDLCKSDLRGRPFIVRIRGDITLDRVRNSINDDSGWYGPDEAAIFGRAPQEQKKEEEEVGEEICTLTFVAPASMVPEYMAFLENGLKDAREKLSGASSFSEIAAQGERIVAYAQNLEALTSAAKGEE